MQSHVSLNSFFPYNPMTAEALDEVILLTLSENHASNLCFGVSVLVEMNLATRKELLEFAKSFLNAST